jgi:hypothetical protein
MKKHGIEILEVFDDEKEFFVINNTKCMCWRYINWPYADKSFEEQVNQITLESIVPHHTIVFANNKSIDILNTIHSLYNQALKPTKITIVRKNNCTLLPSELANMFKDLNIPWRIENLMLEYSDEEIIDTIVPFVEALVYSVYYAGFIVPKDTLEQLNNKITNEFLQFCLLEPNNTGNGLTVSQKIHKLYQGNKDCPLKEKLKADDCPFILPIKNIIPNFPNE